MMTTESATRIAARFYAGEHDIAAIAELHMSCEAVDQLDDAMTAQELLEVYGEPGYDPHSNVRLWHDGDGRLVGNAEVWPPKGGRGEAVDPAIFFWLKIHPELRDGELEDEAFAWALGRATALQAERGEPLRLHFVLRDKESHRDGALRARGFAPVRYFLRMGREIAQGVAAPELGPGWSIRAGELSDEAYAQLHNDVWVDHFGYQPWAAEDVRHHRQEASYRAELDLIAYAPDGTAAGFCWCSLQPLAEASGAPEGYIGLLGVRRAYRNAGVGRALLREGMHRLAATGATRARLGVDGASPTGAPHLYTKEGFTTLYTRILYERPV
jgi:ribosomal protein S18 acetylase RimI-like enzyme